MTRPWTHQVNLEQPGDPPVTVYTRAEGDHLRDVGSGATVATWDRLARYGRGAWVLRSGQVADVKLRDLSKPRTPWPHRLTVWVREVITGARGDVEVCRPYLVEVRGREYHLLGEGRFPPRKAAGVRP